MHERTHCQTWTGFKRSLNQRGFGAAAHTVASVSDTPTWVNELLRIYQEPLPVTSFLWNPPQPTLTRTHTLLPWHMSCLALLSPMFQLEIKYSFFKKTFPDSDRIRTFLLCGHVLPLFNLHGSCNYLSNTIFRARWGVPPGLCLFCSPLIPVPSEGLELQSVLSKCVFCTEKYTFLSC